MALTKESKITQIEVHGDYKHICVVTDTFVKEDGVQIARTRHRKLISCGHINDWSSKTFIETDISGEASDVQAICNTTWTDAVKTAWKDKLIADKGL
jgi:hypothetical protein